MDYKDEKHLLCQTVCKYCYRVLLRATLVALVKWKLTLRLLMSYISIYIYMELLVKPEMLTSYIWTYVWQRETVSFYLLHNVSTLNQCREVSCVTFVCKHFAS